MKALTLHQPWASLISLGVKTLETRSWSTKYRGPLAIHAGLHSVSGIVGEYCTGVYAEPVRHAIPCDCDLDDEVLGDLCAKASGAKLALLHDERAHGWSFATFLPLGAIVATCELVDVVPMVEPTGNLRVGQLVVLSDRLDLWPNEAHGACIDVSDQAPYGDFAPGRFAWMLADITPLPEPIPAKGHQGLWEWAGA